MAARAWASVTFPSATSASIELIYRIDHPDVLDLAILGLLHEQELHGYEIRRRLRDELGLFANISFGSLYPALSRLESAGAVTVTESTGSPAAPPSRRPVR